MSFKVRIESFEGPFDLLLYLVSRQKVDVGSISVSRITDQYLDEISHLENLDLDVASDFLLVAATLLKIKAENLLPRMHGDVEVDEDIARLTPSEARDVLVERLLTYKQYKNAAASLAARAQLEQRMHVRPFGPDAEFRNVAPDFLAGVSLESLGRRAAAALSKRDVELLESEHIARKVVPVETYVRSIHELVRTKKRVKFSELVPAGSEPAIAVVTFLALLELYKRNMITLRQKVTFGEIEARYIEGSGELVFESEEAGDSSPKEA